MQRYDLINFLIQKNGYKSYLEIGVAYGYCYFNVHCQDKECCDPFPKEEMDPYVTYRMTSDEMFASIPKDKKWDIIFVDGLHTEDVSSRDIINGLRHLNPGGKILVHDCLPETEERTGPNYNGGDEYGIWNGDVYKVIPMLALQDIRYCTVNTDFGIGVVEYCDFADRLTYPEKSFVTYAGYVKNWMDWLQVVSVEEFIEHDGNCSKLYKKAKMTTISTCLIVKNEANCIARCIESVLPFSDEVIIYDTGSDDGTQDICRSYEKVKVIQGTWKNDFAWARNESFKYATMDYIMWVDADDIIDNDSIEWLKIFKATNLKTYTRVDLQYIYDYGDDGSYTLMFYRGRLFRRSHKPLWHGRIHEWVDNSEGRDIICEVPDKDCVIKHKKHDQDPERNLKIYKEMEEAGEITSGRDWFYYGRECMWHESHDSAREKFAKALECQDLWNIDCLNLFMDQRNMCLAEGDTYGALTNAMKASVCTKVPRADVSCAIGDWFLDMGSYKVAEFWFKLALEDTNTDMDKTFMPADKSGYHPALQLCVVEYNLGNKEESKRYNELALTYKPDDPTALANRQFFQ